MKYTEHNGLEMSISLTSSRGRYEMSAKVGDTTIKAETTDAEIYDNFSDAEDGDNELHEWAVKSAYGTIMRKFNDQCEDY